MADTKISELTAAPGVTADDLFVVVDGGATKKATAGQVRDFVNASTGAVNVPHVAGRWYVAHRGALNTGAAATVMRLSPFVLTETLTIDALGARVNTLFSGGLFGLAIYAHNAVTGNPTGAALAQVMGLSTTTLGVRSAVLGAAVQLPPGVYWAALLVDNTTAVVQAVGLQSEQGNWIGDSDIAVVTTGSSNAQGAKSVTGSGYGAGFIDLTGATFGTVNNIGGPALCFRVASVP